MNISDIGFYFLFLACLLCFYSATSGLFAAKLKNKQLFISAKLAALLSFLFILFSGVLLWLALFQRDYSVAYVFKNSSDDLPSWYTFTAFWSSLEGSHLLWTLFLSLYAAIAVWTAPRTLTHIIPYANAALQLVLCWMTGLAFTYSDVFARILPAPANGQGMNTLLQNPYMAIHPPMLFTGYTALAVPFSYAVGALAFGDLTEGWLMTVRRWTLYAWCALTAGIFLGGRWAYVELGWAGYWAWDPVENSSFLPWLFATALLHALIVQDKFGQLKRLSILLAFLAFFMSFFGTFITRSGVISSVHSFAESPIGSAYLGFLAVLIVSVLAIYFWKADSILPAETAKVWGVSKESALILTQFLLITFAAIVMVGTLYPIISEAVVGQRTSVQAPYFNAFAPWLGLGFISAIAIGNLLRYGSGGFLGGWKLQVIALALSCIESAVFCKFGNIFETQGRFNLGAQVIGVVMCFWCINCLSAELIDRLKQLRFNAAAFFKFNTGFFGGYVAHLGVMVAILGFLGNYRGVNQEVALESGATKSVLGYDFTFNGMRTRREANVTLFEAPLEVKKDSELIEVIVPARSRYPTKAELLNEIGLSSTFWRDIYVVISDFDKEKGAQVTLQVHINPTVRLVWMSVVLMVLGGLIALCDRRRGARSRDVFLRAAALLLCVGALSFASIADSAEKFEDVASDLRCPTCTGLSVLDSEAAFSVQIKDEVKRQINAGKSKTDILNFFTERYGPWILRAPPKSGFNLIAWLVPGLILILGPFFVWFRFFRRKDDEKFQGVLTTEQIALQMKQELESLRVKS